MYQIVVPLVCFTGFRGLVQPLENALRFQQLRQPPLVVNNLLTPSFSQECDCRFLPLPLVPIPIAVNPFER